MIYTSTAGYAEHLFVLSFYFEQLINEGINRFSSSIDNTFPTDVNHIEIGQNRDFVVDHRAIH